MLLKNWYHIILCLWYLLWSQQWRCSGQQLPGTGQWQVGCSVSSLPPPGHGGTLSSGSSVHLWCTPPAPPGTPVPAAASANTQQRGRKKERWEPAEDVKCHNVKSSCWRLKINVGGLCVDTELKNNKNKTNFKTSFRKKKLTDVKFWN